MYEQLSRFYDGFTDKEYYLRWIDYVLGFLNGRRSGADVGCGTGAFTVEMIKAGKEVVGVDVSSEMLDAAFKRAVKAGVKPKFLLQDARRLTLSRPVEFITALNDVVNYMKNPLPFFKAAAKNLKNGGLFLFDVSSEYKLKNVLAGRTFSDTAQGTTYVWENSPVGKNGAVDMNLKFFTLESDGRYSLSEERQRQYVHTYGRLSEMLKECGLSYKVYGDLTRKKPKEKAQRLHFAAVKGEI